MSSLVPEEPAPAPMALAVSLPQEPFSVTEHQKAVWGWVDELVEKPHAPSFGMTFHVMSDKK